MDWIIMNGNKKDRIASSNDHDHGANTNHPNLKRTSHRRVLRQQWIVGKTSVRVTKKTPRCAAQSIGYVMNDLSNSHDLRS
jgi:hypothetical protein